MVAVFCCLLSSVQALAQGDQTLPKFDSYSDLGGVGLLQIPSARMAPDGEFSIASTLVAPYLRTAVTFQALPWLEGVVRYTSIQNRLYGPESFSGQQNYKDKSLDFKLRLQEESSSLPQMVLGIRDVGGTGLFSGEYVALNKRFYNFDFTLGLGWGYLGNRGTIPNPLGFLSSSFKQQRVSNGQTGTLSSGYFHGEKASIFGGINYQTPISGLTLKLELDGNDYRSEPLGNSFNSVLPFNFGLSYAYDNKVDLSLGFERGNTIMAQFVLHSNMHSAGSMPKLDPPPVVVKPREPLKVFEPSVRPIFGDVSNDALRLTDALSLNGFAVGSVEIRARQAIAKISQNKFRNQAKAIGRAARIMANEAPPEVEVLTLVSVEQGLETQRVSLLRKDLQKAVQYEGSPEEIATHARILPPLTDLVERPEINKALYPISSWGWSPAMKHQIGGPDAPYLYQVYLKGDGDLQLTSHLSAMGEIGFNITDNLDQLKLSSDSVLPHVRSDIKEYLKQGKTGLSRLQLDYMTNLGSSWYGRLSAGLFEEMFGGVGGELLLKPYGQRWAMGLEINRVRQRNYDQLFSFLGYEVSTGHLDFYYRLPFYNVEAQISAGQYLAGDRGVTVGFSRQFDNGAVFNVFATKTNVSAAQFGEGSFDKGISIAVPLDLISLYSSRGMVGMGWRPLTRDGGQRLLVGKKLYPTVSDSNPDKLMRGWGQLLE
jgi:hypothetical protein